MIDAFSVTYQTPHAASLSCRLFVSSAPLPLISLLHLDNSLFLSLPPTTSGHLQFISAYRRSNGRRRIRSSFLPRPFETSYCVLDLSIYDLISCLSPSLPSLLFSVSPSFLQARHRHSRFPHNFLAFFLYLNSSCITFCSSGSFRLPTSFPANSLFLYSFSTTELILAASE